MTPEELKAQEELLLNVRKEVKSHLENVPENWLEHKNIKGLQTKIDELVEKNKKLETDKLDNETISKAVNEIAQEFKAYKEEGAKITKKTSAIMQILVENKSKIDGFKGNQSGSLFIETKATQLSSDIGSGDSFNDLGRDAYFDWHEGGAVGRIPVRKAFLRKLFRKGKLKGEFIKYLDEDTVVRDAKGVAGCGTTTHNTKVTWKVRTVQIQKFRDFLTICQDMLDDYDFVEAEIRYVLESSLQLKIDSDLLLGTGVAPVISSISSAASTFSASAVGADYSNSVHTPTLIDLIVVAGLQIQAFGQNNAWNPDTVLLNPRDLGLMKLLKDADGNYIRNSTVFGRLYSEGGQDYIDGMLLVANPLVPANSFYIFDKSKGTVYSKPGVGIEFSYENRENFEAELVTVKIYERLQLLIRNVDANAFMYVPDINAALLAITKV